MASSIGLMPPGRTSRTVGYLPPRQGTARWRQGKRWTHVISGRNPLSETQHCFSQVNENTTTNMCFVLC